jgi:hypothetical protein
MAKVGRSDIKLGWRSAQHIRNRCCSFTYAQKSVTFSTVYYLEHCILYKNVSYKSRLFSGLQVLHICSICHLHNIYWSIGQNSFIPTSKPVVHIIQFGPKLVYKISK